MQTNQRPSNLLLGTLGFDGENYIQPLFLENNTTFRNREKGSILVNLYCCVHEVFQGTSSSLHLYPSKGLAGLGL